MNDMKKIIFLCILGICSALISPAQKITDKYFEEIVNLPLSFDDVASCRGAVVPEDDVYKSIIQLHNYSIPEAGTMVNEWRAKCKFLYDDRWYYIIEHSTTMDFVEWFLFTYPEDNTFPIMLKILDGEIGKNPAKDTQYGGCFSIFFNIKDGFVNIYHLWQNELPPIEKYIFDLKNLKYLPRDNEH